MHTCPSVQFKIDPAKDFEVLNGFLRDARFDGGRNLEWAVFKNHPGIKLLLRGEGMMDEKSIKDYIIQFFTKHGVEIKKNVVEYRTAWQAKQKDFFRLTNIIFASRAWPEGKYAAYATMWGMFPRSLEDKTFQVPAICKEKLHVNVIIAHEMLHFMFYDFLFEKYPELNDKEKNFLTWNASEIFNSLVQNSESWLNVFSSKTMTYPEHADAEIRLRTSFPQVTSENLNAVTKRVLAISKKITSSQK